MILKEKQILCAREGVPGRAVRAVDISNEPTVPVLMQK